ncbi:MAG: DUF3800 domain-containing protein [Chloroflexota bacterium]
MGTWVLYVDESGDCHSHSVPLLSGQTPLFAVSGVALPLSQWRLVDREYLRLKRRFFRNEIEESTRSTGKRAEIWEAKGNSLTAPRNRDSQRNRAFLLAILDLIARCQGRLFSVVFIKDAERPPADTTMYTVAFQTLAKHFSAFLAERDDRAQGLIIFDRKLSRMDWQVAYSHMSFVFGNEHGRQLTNILEAPLAADSRLTAGLQIADNVGSIIYACHYQRYCADVPGAADYTHVRVYYWRLIQALQWRGRTSQDARGKYGFSVFRRMPDQGADMETLL